MSKRTKIIIFSITTVLSLTSAGILRFAHYRSHGSSTGSTTESGKSHDGVVGDSTIIVGNENPKPTIDDLLAETNKARTSNSVTALTLNVKLNASAQAKCEDMIAKDYWAHNDPSGTTPWHFITEAGTNYDQAAENLAYGFSTASAVINGWMNSEEHRTNLLNPVFSEVGFGICSGDNYQGKGKQTIVVQHFIKPKASQESAAPTSSTQTSTYKAYVASVCTKTPIPYQTKYVDASYLDVGQTQSYGGIDGYTQTCTADSTGYTPAPLTLQPYDKTVYVGTRQPTGQ